MEIIDFYCGILKLIVYTLRPMLYMFDQHFYFKHNDLVGTGNVGTAQSSKSFFFIVFIYDNII